MSEAVALHGSAGSVRARLLGPGAEGAIHKGYDVWGPIDFYLSELRDRYLAGEVKGVMTAVPLKMGRAFEAFSIVPVPPAQRAAAAARHRERLLLAVPAQYKDAVARAIGGSPKRVKRRRYETNKALGGSAPSIAATRDHFAQHPAALAAAEPIRRVWDEVAAL